MSSSRRFSLVWRWSVSAMALTALFWGVWHLVMGSVPVITSLQLGPDTAFELPLAMSRWWDVLFAGVWTVPVVLFVTSDLSRSDGELIFGMGFGLIFCVSFVAAISFTYGMFNDLDRLYAGLTTALIIGLIAGLRISPTAGLGVGLTIGLGVGLIFSLTHSLIIGLGVGLTAALVYYVPVGFVCSLFRGKAWHGIRKWYLAR